MIEPFGYIEYKEYDMKFLSPLIAATALTVIVLPSTGVADEAESASADLTVNLSGLYPLQGTVQIGVYASEEAWASGEALAGTSVHVDAENVIAIIEGLPLGEYGLKMFHDVDGDGSMGTNAIGIPNEPYAFSNNAMGRFGPASWNDSVFQVNAEDNTQNIHFD
jgi:uncharacterized protein (DUF2141 family)